MPWKGRPSFPRYLLGREEYTDYVCQCPERGDLHFHFSTILPHCLFIEIVSMPWKGRPSFPQSSHCVSFGFRIMCQCPERGDLHFHREAEHLKRSHEVCQCPERGDLHFHTKKGWLGNNSSDIVSMPWKGRPSFPQTFKYLLKLTSNECQCPERGDLHFHEKEIENLMKHDRYLCQCPERGDLHFHQVGGDSIKSRLE